MLDPNYSDLLSAFCARDVRFLVVGAYALGVHGRPRATMDFEVWVEASAANAPRVLAALRDFGAPLHGVSEQDLAAPGVGLQIGVAPIANKRASGRTKDLADAEILEELGRTK